MFLRSFSNKNDRIVWFDIETTGFNIFHHEILEIAALDNLGNTFNHLIGIQKNIPKKITELTGITRELIQDKPPIGEILNNFSDFLWGTNIENTPVAKYLIGHNSIAFDYPFIRYQCIKHKIKLPKIKIIDTMKMAQYILPEHFSHSLHSLSLLFAIDNNNAHRAMNDVYATSTLYNNLCSIFRKNDLKSSPNNIYNITSI